MDPRFPQASHHFGADTELARIEEDRLVGAQSTAYQTFLDSEVTAAGSQPAEDGGPGDIEGA